MEEREERKKMSGRGKFVGGRDGNERRREDGGEERREKGM